MITCSNHRLGKRLLQDVGEVFQNQYGFGAAIDQLPFEFRGVYKGLQLTTTYPPLSAPNSAIGY